MVDITVQFPYYFHNPVDYQSLHAVRPILLKDAYGCALDFQSLCLCTVVKVVADLLAFVLNIVSL